MLSGLDSFVINRAEIVKDQAAASALADLETMRKASAPYGLIKDIDGLVATVKLVNDDLLEKKRTHAVTLIHAAVAQLASETDKGSASDELSNRALKPLNELRQQVASFKELEIYGCCPIQSAATSTAVWT